MAERTVEFKDMGRGGKIAFVGLFAVLGIAGLLALLPLVASGGTEKDKHGKVEVPGTATLTLPAEEVSVYFDPTRASQLLGREDLLAIDVAPRDLVVTATPVGGGAPISAGGSGDESDSEVGRLDVPEEGEYVVEASDYDTAGYFRRRTRGGDPFDVGRLGNLPVSAEVTIGEREGQAYARGVENVIDFVTSPLGIAAIVLALLLLLAGALAVRRVLSAAGGWSSGGGSPGA